MTCDFETSGRPRNHDNREHMGYFDVAVRAATVVAMCSDRDVMTIEPARAEMKDIVWK
jgi:hypothetical protein